MADLLIHSMAEFAEIILPVLEMAGARHVVEIGAEHGTMSRALATWLGSNGGNLTAVDPHPSAEAASFFESSPHAALVRGTSLEVLPTLIADGWLVDGDHNYYTVRNESEIIWDRCRLSGRPFLAFYHDVAWPCARRDLYYAPDRIPAAHRQPFSWYHGIVPDNAGLVPGGFRGEGQWAAAIAEGGPRNGVKTAIEDFVVGREEHLVWAEIPAVFGLGILFSREAPWSVPVREFLAPLHANPLLARLERNRLDCYLAVIAHQDRMNADDAQAA